MKDRMDAKDHPTTDDSAAEYWLGFDLGGTKMLATLYDAEWNPLCSKKRKTKGHEGADAGLERIVETIGMVLEKSEVPLDAVRGVGIGCPGPIDVEEGVIIEAPNLGWEKANVRKAIASKYSFPSVVLNDVDAGVYGEYLFGAGHKAKCVVGIFPGTGIGGGCVYDGSILQGRHVTCMEIGHVLVMPDGPMSGSPTPGTLESVASRLAISAAAAQAAYRGQAPRLMDKAGTDLSLIRSGVLADAVANGDEVVKKILIAAARQLGRAAGGLIHILAPEAIVLGGGLVEAMPKLFLNTIKSTIDDFVLPSFRGTYEVAVAKLGDDAGVLGAAAWGRHVITESRP